MNDDLDSKIRWEEGFPRCIQVPYHWYDLIRACWFEIDAVCSTAEVAQIKTKFGQLRFYVECRCDTDHHTNHHTNEVDDIVRKYEHLVYDLENAVSCLRESSTFIDQV